MAPVDAPAATTQEELRELASFHALNGVVLSLYVGFDPSVTTTGDETATRLASLLEQARRAGAAPVERLGRAARIAFEDDLAHAREEVLRRLGPGGVACFADVADELWRVIELRGSFPDLARVGVAPHLVPLVSAPCEERALVAAVGRERGEIFEIRDGALEPLVDFSEEAPRRHRAGQSWRQPSLERHIDELARAHLRRVAAGLDGLVRARGGEPVVVAAEKKQAAAFVALLSDQSASAVAGVVHPEAHADAAGLLPLVRSTLGQRRDEEESELVERWNEADGRGQGAVHGWADTLAAASDGRVETLLFRDGTGEAVFACRACGRGSATGGTCPLDGGPLDPEPDGVDLAIRLTLARGGHARLIRRRPDLDRVGGIGALLNF